MKMALCKFKKDKGMTPSEISTGRASHNFLTGFTLIEMMIVIAIIALLAVMAIPSFLASRITANETSAIASLKVIYSGCQSYYMTQNPSSYPTGLEALTTPLADPPYIDEQLGVAKEKSGYAFTYQLGQGGETFELYAEPKTQGRSGNRYFFCNETGVITFKVGGRASPNDPAVQ